MKVLLFVFFTELLSVIAQSWSLNASSFLGLAAFHTLLQIHAILARSSNNMHSIPH